MSSGLPGSAVEALSLSYPPIMALTGAGPYTDLFTCPAGRRLYVRTVSFLNSTGGAVHCFPAVKISGTYYQIGTTLSPNDGNVAAQFPGYLLEAGEVLAANSDTAGVGVLVQAQLFEDTLPIRSVKLTAFVAGANLVYQPAAGYAAFVLSWDLAQGNSAALLFCQGGGSANVTWYRVMAGQVPFSKNQVTNSVLVASGSLSSPLIADCVSDHDGFWVTVDTPAAPTIAWLNVLEVPVAAAVVISGKILLPDGVTPAPLGTLVYYEVFSPPQSTSSGELVSARESVATGSTGLWSVGLQAGKVVRFIIPAAGYDGRVLIPATDADLFTLPLL